MSGKDAAKEVKRLHSEVQALLANMYSEDEIISKFKEEGLEPYYIQTIIENINDDIADKVSFRNSIIMGLVYLVGGLLINVLSYTIAGNINSLFFYLFWGIIVLGITTIVRGFILYKK